MIGSMTNAQRARRALLTKGISAHLTKNETDDRQGGCAYGIELGEHELLSAISILRAIGLEYRVL